MLNKIYYGWKGWIKSKVLKAVKDRRTSETRNESKGITSGLEGYRFSLIESYVYGNKELAGGRLRAFTLAGARL